MSLPFFNSVLSALGRRLNYESISNLYGNSFCKEASKYIQEAYPLSKPNKLGSGFANILNQATIIKSSSSSNNEEAKKALEKDFGDLSWAEGVL